MPTESGFPEWSKLRAMQLHRLPTFFLVGVSSVAIDGAVYFFLTSLTALPSLSKGASFVIGASFSYIFNGRFTFDGRFSRHSPIAFAALYVASLVINVGGNNVFLSVFSSFNYSEILAFFVVTIITTIWNYMGMALWVFRGEGN